MRLVRSFVRSLPIATLFVFVRATAASAAPIPIELEDNESDVLESTNATCTLSSGTLGVISSAWSAPYAWKTFAWKIPRSSCDACPRPQVLNLTAVRFRMRWLTACTASADVSIVGATGDPQCPTPDPNQVLCGPVHVALDGPAQTGVTYDVPLPADCCIFEDAFVLVRFSGLEECAREAGISPGITQTTNACVTCEQFYEVEGLHPFPSEWCSPPITKSLWFEVDADCCSATPSRRHSWGGVKTIYR